MPWTGSVVRRRRWGSPRLPVVLATAGLLVGGVLAGSPAAASGSTGGGELCDGLAVTIAGTEDDDVLVGTAGRDVIAGYAGSDVIRGRGGDDVICAGDDGDNLRGGGGNDRLFGELDGEIGSDRPGDFLFGGPGDDYLDIGYQYHWDRVIYRGEPAGIHADLESGTATTPRGTDTIYRPEDIGLRGSRYADTIVGTERSDSIWGKAGDDTIEGRGGDDDINGQAGDDVIDSGVGCDMIYGERGADLLKTIDDGAGCWSDGGPGDDHLIGSPIWDTHLDGGPGDDLIEGLGYPDKLFGREGNDILDGGADGGDLGNAGPGTDTCISIERRKNCEHPEGGGREVLVRPLGRDAGW